MDLLNPQDLLKTIGVVGLFAIVFAESGLLVGFFLPGDTLLFTAGVFSLKGDLPGLPILIVGCSLAAIAGDQLGYAVGKRLGPALFKRPNSMFFKAENIEKAQRFFARHGGKTVMLARFLPVIRTFTPIVAGAGNMKYRNFALYNVLGGTLWAGGVLGLGYEFGEKIGVDKIDKYLLPIIGLVIILSFAPVILELYKSRKNGSRANEQNDREVASMLDSLSAQDHHTDT